MSGERTGSASASDVTQREFVGGQKLFGRYTLIKILGRGGMGIVWLAHDEELEREVALKFLPDGIIHDASVLNDLKRETRRCLELTHKNIVRIYDFVRRALRLHLDGVYRRRHPFEFARAEGAKGI